MPTVKKSILILTLIISCSTLTFAGEIKSITLKDGTVIKGTVTKFENGVYTISSEKLGEISVKDNDVAVIQANSSSQSVNPLVTPNALGSGSSDLRSQVQQMQGTIMSDPTIMQQIQQLVA